jgi:hypothetical protein
VSFNPLIPQNSDPIAVSQNQLRSNYSSIFNTFAQNHVSINQNDQGIHTSLLLRAQSGDPTTSSAQVSLYNKLSSNIPALFYRPANSATPIQMTYPSISTGSSLTAQYTFVAGPFVIYGGLLKNITSGQVVTLTPTTTLLYVGLTSANLSKPATNVGGAGAIPTSMTGSTFTIGYQTLVAGTTLDAYYLAIGM